ncbi:lysophospholipid acyltransferase family protein [Marinospirillum alkaliphilum]|uniref:KDO2-lipid IV(A) lauroyltransferase n=1 Tax=Marinospirillum alkaliphilum DSM 21637 TaxID=1122209 RepID=A0A1K1ZXT2_9GAMM|nr:lysophospholipid acyltransferase family protein [Marinospirillum alkaliphilum]SFX78436.1 KDO2-lipid IV(A) lauroyltransferase [Marinospirillum alkaliphilum DSM 21637]
MKAGRKKSKKNKYSRPVRAFFIRNGWKLLSYLPLRALQALAVPLGWLIWRGSRRERRVTLTNLKLAFPDLSVAERKSLGKASLIESTRTLLEMGFMWMAPKDRVLASVRSVQGAEELERLQQQQQPVILLGPHIGQWELIGQWFSARFPLTCMYSLPKVRELDPVIRQGRCRTGGFLVPADVKGVAGLLKALRRGEAVGILPDQVPDRGQGGVFAPFYGHPVLTATLLPKLVQKTGARVFTALAKRLPRGEGYELILIPADERVYSTDEQEATAGVNASVEQIISYAPTQYQWAYKRFKRVPKGTPKPYKSRRF